MPFRGSSFFGLHFSQEFVGCLTTLFAHHAFSGIQPQPAEASITLSFMEPIAKQGAPEVLVITLNR
jgi:hypothetical protein